MRQPTARFPTGLQGRADRCWAWRHCRRPKCRSAIPNCDYKARTRFGPLGGPSVILIPGRRSGPTRLPDDQMSGREWTHLDVVIKALAAPLVGALGDGRQSQHWELAIGLAEVSLEPGGAFDHLSPCLLALLSLELVDPNVVFFAGHLHPDLFGVGGNVVIPAGVLRSTAGGGHDDPASLPIVKAGDRRRPARARAGAHSGEVQQVHPPELIPCTPVNPNHEGCHDPAEQGRRGARSPRTTRKLVDRHD